MLKFVVANQSPIAFNRKTICPSLRVCSEGVIWSITLSLSPQSLVARTAQHQKMPVNSDSAGQAILKLLHRAAGAAEANSRQALETAQRLSSQLHAAQDRIAELEAELQLYREKADRAEEWLSKITDGD